MGLIVKKDNHDEDSLLGDIDIIERSDVPDDLPKTDFGLVGGKSAADIAHDTDEESEAAATQAVLEDEAAYNKATMAAVDKVVEEEAVVGGSEDAADAVAADVEADKTDGVLKDEDEGQKPIRKGDNTSGGKPSGSSAPNIKLVVIVAVIVAIVFAIVGFFIGSGGIPPKTVGAATISEQDLDRAVASWTYKGKKHTVSAREAIESQVSLDAAKNEDGAYVVPAADAVLNYVRTQIQLEEADERGITASDDEIKEQAEKSLGTSDFSTIASQYKLSEDQAKETLRQQTVIAKLSAQIAPLSAVSPEQPTKPAEGGDAAASKEYADYIIKLAGDEWDAKKGTWASEDSAFAQAFAGQEFTADSATYAQALSAYYVAYQRYAEEAAKASTKYKDYMNGLFAQADIDLYGLYV